jgi:heme/copper-type cytochrome/quinol oxidase subunit 4
MTGSTDAHEAHDTHGDHPVSSSIVGLILVAVFTALFAVMTTKSFDAMVATVAVLLSGWTLFTIWALDRD